MRNKLCILFAVLLCCTTIFAQSSVFSFLSLPISARLNMLGGQNVSVKDGDISMSLCNPALLSVKTNEQLQMNYAYYMQGTNLASVLYSPIHRKGRKGAENAEIDTLNYFAVSVYYLDYGKMQYADECGNLTGGTFSARDMLIQASYARQLGKHFTVGVSLKPIYSNYEHYNSFALGADIGGHFETLDKSFQLGLSLQNIGWQIVGFYTNENGTVRERLPLNLELGLNYRIKHAPIRLCFTAHNLQQWDISPQTAAASGNVKWYDMLFRHTIWAIDVVPKSDKFYFTLSYDHRRHQELALQQRSLAGFALGAGLNLKTTRLGFAFSQQLKGQFVYQFMVALNINELK